MPPRSLARRRLLASATSGLELPLIQASPVDRRLQVPERRDGLDVLA
jgi:hypothetical protein